MEKKHPSEKANFISKIFHLWVFSKQTKLKKKNSRIN